MRPKCYCHLWHDSGEYRLHLTIKWIQKKKKKVQINDLVVAFAYSFLLLNCFPLLFSSTFFFFSSFPSFIRLCSNLIVGCCGYRYVVWLLLHCVSHFAFRILWLSFPFRSPSYFCSPFMLCVHTRIWFALAECWVLRCRGLVIAFRWCLLNVSDFFVFCYFYLYFYFCRFYILPFLCASICFFIHSWSGFFL